MVKLLVDPQLERMTMLTAHTTFPKHGAKRTDAELHDVLKKIKSAIKDCRGDDPLIKTYPALLPALVLDQIDVEFLKIMSPPGEVSAMELFGSPNGSPEKERYTAKVEAYTAACTLVFEAFVTAQRLSHTDSTVLRDLVNDLVNKHLWFSDPALWRRIWPSCDLMPYMTSNPLSQADQMVSQMGKATVEVSFIKLIVNDRF